MIVSTHAAQHDSYSLEAVFSNMTDVPILWTNRYVIWHKLFGKAEGTTVARKKLLKVSANFFRELNIEYNIYIKHIADLDLAITTSFLNFVKPQKQNAIKTDFFRSILRAIDVPDSLIPDNPFPRRRLRDPTLYTPDQTRRAVKILKEECWLVVKRCETYDKLRELGTDPRKEYGGLKDDWLKPENGIFVARRVTGFGLFSWRELQARGIPNFRNVMHGFEKCPGAPFTNGKGLPDIKRGWRGQIRWVHPYVDDIAPFVILSMIHTGVNFSAIARVKAGADSWSEPYPFTVSENDRDRYVFMLFEKDRGTAMEDRGTGPNIRIVSSTRPWSHPYRIFRFVEQLTRPLREEMKAEIERLEALATPSATELRKLTRLQKIKDDLFIYRTETTVFGSLAEHAYKHIPDALEKCLKRVGLETNIRNLRSLKINFAYEFSGNNFFVAQIMAQHRSGKSSALYLRRMATISRHYEMFRGIFGLSIALIKVARYNHHTLKTILEAQGFVGEKLDNLMNPEFRTRWGNNCATPFAPPPGFDVDTPPGSMCFGQNCADGCPSARWFPDVETLVQRQIASLKAQRRSLGFMSTAGSSLDSQIQRCDDLLTAWQEAAA
ncbi:hypothetical protein C3Y90_24750 [Rhizobium sp. UPM1134]|nr:hypothetical protein [Rhizobium ruizarguesonis]